MRILTALTVGMGVLILLGTTILVVALVKRPTSGTGGTPMALTLDEPAGTRIAAIAAVADQLALELQGGGPDRVVLINPRSGAIVGRVSLPR